MQFRCHEDVEDRKDHTLVWDKDVKNLNKRLWSGVERSIGEDEGAIVVYDTHEQSAGKNECQLSHLTMGVQHATVVMLLCRLHTFVVTL